MTPRWVIKYFAPLGARETFDVQMSIAELATSIVVSSEHSDRTVIHGIMNSDLPVEEKHPQRVVQVAWGLILVGTETTAATLEKLVFHLLSNQTCLRRLKKELTAFADIGGDISFAAALRRLPYLTAVICEGQRLASAVSGRLPRIDRRTSCNCNGIILPSGTSISMSIDAMHQNADIYHNPAEFDPERFLRQGEKERCEAYLVPFGKGSRGCWGQYFALLSLHLILSRLLQRFDLELFETTTKDIEMVHEMFAQFPAADAEDVRVLVK